MLLGTLCAPWTWLTVSFPMLMKFLAITSSNILSVPFLSLLSSETPITWMNVGSSNVPEVFQVVFISFHSFFYILFCSSDSTVLSPESLICSTARLCCYWSLLVYHSPLFVCSSVIWRTSLHSLHCPPKILGHLHCYHPEFFFWKAAHLHFI